jgi:hypothetical protein
MVTTLLLLFGGYLALGVVFALVFVAAGAGRVDTHARGGSWGFRLLILPGAAALWPLLLGRWVQGIHEPPEQRDPHRCAAQASPARPAHPQSTST